MKIELNTSQAHMKLLCKHFNLLDADTGILKIPWKWSGDLTKNYELKMLLPRFER